MTSVTPCGGRSAPGSSDISCRHVDVMPSGHCTNHWSMWEYFFSVCNEAPTYCTDDNKYTIPIKLRNFGQFKHTTGNSNFPISPQGDMYMSFSAQGFGQWGDHGSIIISDKSWSYLTRVPHSTMINARVLLSFLWHLFVELVRSEPNWKWDYEISMEREYTDI